MRLLFSTFFLCCVLGLNAQDILTYRPKVVEFSTEYLSNYKAYEKPTGESNSISSIEKDNLLRVRLGVPVILKEKTLFAFQFKYYRQFYGLGAGQQGELFDFLNNNSLYNAGLNFLYQRNISKEKKFTLIVLTELASDTWGINQFSNRYLAMGEYSKQLNESTIIGYGGVVNYALGLLNIYPTFTYKKQLSDKMLFEAILPSSINLRYHLRESTYFIFQTELVNWRFNLTDALENEAHLITLQRADIYFKLKLEQEIHDWLWLGVDVGYVNNLTYFTVNPGDRIKKAISEYDIKDSSYLRFSIFLVPPRKLWDSL
ncbi:DUF6268 family outer membrane beta-barrel protein [Roseivirga echinicomitans]|uniref:DUF6268 domain-containing protein n=1 Tax=Roseivirga echinicomitans TaxID=296218 RepID=A0A150XU17_9BACT|nr:DUF6268 family outer membrane beta-barrel protein [Roseivirga echinicomitans]KYG82237.1 hypothetical protein AWN68_15455 [Roseivirga echinicomitans]